MDRGAWWDIVDGVSELEKIEATLHTHRHTRDLSENELKIH